MTNEEIATKLDRLNENILGLKQELVKDISENSKNIAVADAKIDAYQKSTSQVTNLAFGLIVTATISITTAALTIIVPMIIQLVQNR